MSTIYLDTPSTPNFKTQLKTALTPSRSWFKDTFPILQWLPNYNRQWFYGDFICAITVGIVVMPQSMAYAKMAGLPPQYGLYSSVIGCLIYPWLGTSKDISIGTTAINSLFMGQITTILVATPEFQDGTWSFTHITSNLALISGLICLAVGLLRLGILYDFICQPAMAGFMAGTAVMIIISQMNKMLGIHDIKTTDPAYLVLGHTLQRLPETHWDAALGLPAVVFLYGVKYGTKYLVRRYPQYATSLGFFNLCRNAIVIVFATLLSFLINHLGHFQASPFKIVHDVPVGFQAMGVPHLDSGLLSHVIPNLVGVVVLQIMEHCCIATSLGKVADYKIRVDQEITTIGLSNVFGAFFGAYPMTGNFCRSAVMSKSGCRTPIASLGVALIVVVSIYFFVPALQYIPEAAVGAIVCHAVSDLIVGPKVWAKFWNTHPSELLIFAAAFFITVFARIDLSVYVPVALSIVVQLFRVARPKYAFPSLHPRLVCFQPQQNLVFENADYLYHKLLAHVKQYTLAVPSNNWNDQGKDTELPALAAIVLDLSGVHRMDYSGMQALAQLACAVDRHAGHPVPLYIVVGTDSVRHALLFAGFGRQQRKHNGEFHNDLKKQDESQDDEKKPTVEMIEDVTTAKDDDSFDNVMSPWCQGEVPPGPIAQIRDRYPFFFLSLPDAACAALQTCQQ